MTWCLPPALRYRSLGWAGGRLHCPHRTSFTKHKPEGIYEEVHDIDHQGQDPSEHGVLTLLWPPREPAQWRRRDAAPRDSGHRADGALSPPPQPTPLGLNAGVAFQPGGRITPSQAPVTGLRRGPNPIWPWGECNFSKLLGVPCWSLDSASLPLYYYYY